MLSVALALAGVWGSSTAQPHTATAAKRFDSGSIAPGQSWSTVMRKTGTLPYVCSFHPGMKATLQVQ